jgi:hypothetical protein
MSFGMRRARCHRLLSRYGDQGAVNRVSNAIDAFEGSDTTEGEIESGMPP